VKDELTPRQVARAIGVSESSLKRWCDQGLLPTTRTPGGHRRLSMAGVLQFLRESGRNLVEPEQLGLPATSGGGPRVTRRARRRLREALVAGDEDVVRQVIFDLHLAGLALAQVFDEVIAGAFEEVGEGWACGEIEVFEERRACEITLRVLHELGRALPPPQTFWTAVGGTPEGDPYSLPTVMAELVLRQAGFHARSLGSGLPLETLAAAIRKNCPDLLWLSVSHLADRRQFLDQFRGLSQTAAELRVALVVGGNALSEDVRREMDFTVHCDRMLHLERFVQILLDRQQQPERKADAAPNAST
jgi:excisionase family DNA binding protein